VSILPPALLSDRTYLGDGHEHGSQEHKADDTLHGLIVGVVGVLLVAAELQCLYMGVVNDI